MSFSMGNGTVIVLARQQVAQAKEWPAELVAAASIACTLSPKARQFYARVT
jgi:hypothetical protein